MPLDHDPSFVALFVKNQRRIYGYILTLMPDCNEADDPATKPFIRGYLIPRSSLTLGLQK